MEKMGGMVHCISTRENILYCIDFLKPNLDMAVDLLADTLLNPTFPDEELEETRTLVELQRENLPSETVSRDLVQRAGYVGQPMGNHHYCPSEIARKVSRETLQKFRKQYYFGDNCVIAAAGIDHEDFVKAVEKKFASLPKGDIAALKRPHSVFTGGQLSEQRVLQEPFVKLAIAFEIGGWKDPLLVPAFVMQQLLGGGKSFSAGGPGKGMYTRLYTEVLNRFYWAEAVESFINVSDPSGILGIDGACEPENMTMMVRTIVDQFAKLANIPVTPEELNRAKNMLKSSMMMQLESRLVVSEDIARQFLTYGYRKPAEVICAEIDAVTAEDIMKVASKMLDGPPAVACVGEDVSHLPSYRDIKQFVQGYNEQMWKAANKK